MTVTSKSMKRFFMSTSEAVSLILSATAVMQGQEIFVLKMREKKIYDLAMETIKKNSSHKKIKIEIIGLREREKLREQLFTVEEKKTMIDVGKYKIILPNKTILRERKKEYKLLAGVS